MGWRFRKSFTVMPGVRVNVSRRGVSATLGSGPLAMHVGPSGTYVNASIPGTGIGYRERLGGPPERQSRAQGSPRSRVASPPSGYTPPSLTAFTPGHLSPEFERSLVALQQARSTEVARLASSRNVAEIRSRSTTAMTNPGLRDFCDALVIAQQERDAITHDLHGARPIAQRLSDQHRAWEQGFFLKRLRKARFAALGVEAIEARDRVAELEEQLRLSSIATVFDVPADVERAYDELLDAYAVLRTCAAIWDVTASGGTDRTRERTSATERIERQRVQFGTGAAEALASPHHVPALGNANGGDLFLYPGVVLYQLTREAFAVLEARDVQVTYTQTAFIETEGLPADATQSGQTWTYVNKNGTPDRRFAHNPAIPIAVYGTLRFRSPSGLCEDYMVSNAHAAANFAAAWVRYTG
jgi:hypothetical protein